MEQTRDVQIQKLVETLEVLEKSILAKEFHRTMADMFPFLESIFHCKQIFFWKNKPREKKQKFLSLKKSSPQDFGNTIKSLDLSTLKTGFFVLQNGLLFCIPSRIGSDKYYYFLESADTSLFDDKTLKYIFESRFTGVLFALERINQVQSLNFIDDVTGLYNQRYLSVLLDQEIERYNRNANPFSVLFVDVDHFKSVNDNNGHMVGSHILKEIGLIIKNAVRAVDSCFRYGGDEFLTVLSGANSEQAMNVARRICETVANTPFVIDGKSIRVTLSIGVACFPEHAQTKEKIIEVADHAMYSGKKASRNIVYVAS